MATNQTSIGRRFFMLWTSTKLHLSGNRIDQSPKPSHTPPPSPSPTCNSWHEFNLWQLLLQHFKSKRSSASHICMRPPTAARDFYRFSFDLIFIIFIYLYFYYRHTPHSHTHTHTQWQLWLLLFLWQINCCAFFKRGALKLGVD